MPLEDLGLKGMLTFSKDKKEFLPGGMMLLGADCEDFLFFEVEWMLSLKLIPSGTLTSLWNLIFDGHTMENSLF